MAEIVTHLAPLVGDKVVDATQNEIGQIVRVAPNVAGYFDALIELRIESKEAGNLTYNNTEIRLKDLPYRV